MTLIRTKGSLCSGTGALDMAVPGKLQFVAESNPKAAAVLHRNNPEVPNFGDITTADWSYAQHHVDLLTSGDPCQSMSVAGRQKASEDERFLWPYVIDMIRKTRPEEIFLENVQNIVSVALVKGGERGGVLKMRLDDLKAAGYAVKWMVLGACAVGAPHHRHRWFLRARYVGVALAGDAERVTMKCGAPRNGSRVLLPTTRARDWNGGSTSSRPIVEGPDLPTAVALLPTPTTSDGTGGSGKSANGQRGYNLRTAVTLLPTPRATDGSNGGPGQRGSKGDLAMGSAVQEEHWEKFAAAIALWEEVLGRPAPDPTVPAPRGGRRLNPALSEWMMGLPQGHVTDGIERNAALTMAGNGVVTLQAQAAWDLLA